MDTGQDSKNNSIEESHTFGSKEIFSLINQLKLSYNNEERMLIIKELGILNDESIPEEILIQKIRENKQTSVFKPFYNSMLSLLTTPLELIVYILSEAKNKLFSFSEQRLSEEIDWVIKKIKNDDIYNFNLNRLSDEINSETELGRTMKLISEYSTDNFTRNKKDDLIAARKFSSERISVFSHANLGNKKSVLASGFKNRNTQHNEISESKATNFEISPKESLKDDKLLELISEIDPFDNVLDFGENQFFNQNFDIFNYLEKEGREKCLSNISYSIFNEYNLFCFVNRNMFHSFLNKIKVGYDFLLPYHNEIHAADVLQTCNIIVISSKVHEKMDLTILDLSGFFIAAIIHDYKHPGKNNNFLINNRDDLALRYNDVSVLENYHVSSAFKVITHKNSKIFSELKNEEYRVVRKRIVECVLATDMAKHSKAMASIKLKLENIKNSNTKESYLVKMISQGEEETNFDRQQEVLNYFIHCADISNSSKPFAISRRWTNLIMEENFLQGDQERQLGLPISFLCDRRTTNIPESQVSFITKIVLPSFFILSQMSPELGFFKDNAVSNLQNWESELRKNEEN